MSYKDENVARTAKNELIVGKEKIMEEHKTTPEEFQKKSSDWFRKVSVEREMYNKYVRDNPMALNRVIGFTFDGMFKESNQEKKP